MKAIHNQALRRALTRWVVINHTTTKFESNSQRFIFLNTFLICCYQSQNYKIWKQFTTFVLLKRRAVVLLSITKLQNLKAIHNGGRTLISMQQVVINHKTTKFESNSQPTWLYIDILVCCYQSQNYKIWKQFTTNLIVYWYISMLLSITKLQNLKAIHNQLDCILIY